MIRAPGDRLLHCPHCGRKTEAQDRRNPFECPECRLVLFFNPAAAVAAFVQRSDGNVLCIRRAHEPARGLLGLPGGFVDYGETAESALAREVREEVGIEIASVAYVASFPNEYVFSDVTYRTLDLFYVATSDNVSAAQPLDQVMDIDWVDPLSLDLTQVAFPSIRQAFELIRRNPKLHLHLPG